MLLRSRVAQPTGTSTSMPPPLTIPAPPKNGRKEKSKPKSEVKAKAKEKEKETKRNRKRKRGDDEAYRDIHDLTAEHLVQHVMRNTMYIGAMLTSQLSAGVGTSRPSRWHHHRASQRQSRIRMSTPSRHSDTLCFGPHRTFYVQRSWIRETPSCYLRRSCARYDRSYEGAVA
jgi:hypothetical protein